MLLPRFPFRLVWSPRKPWGITSKLSGQEVTELFTERMTRKANVLRQFNNYFRRVSWVVQRNAISGDLTAECHPNGPVTVGFGKNKWQLDVSADTLICHTEPAGKLLTTEIGPGTYTTLFGLYAFPATVYSFDVVKAIKKADPTATIKYPWSPFRMIALAALLLIIIIISAASGGSNNTTSNAANLSTPPTTPETTTPENTETDEVNTASNGSEHGTKPSQPLPAASRTIKSHLERLGEGDYPAAFSLMSEAYRSANPGWQANREQGDPEISIVGVGRPHYQGGGTARVYVKFYARDTNRSKGSDTRCRLFKGTVEMIEHGGIWRYEPSGNALTGSVVSGSSCRA